MALEITPNQPIVCVPSTIGDDLVPYDWFLNSNYWSFTPNVNFDINAYGGVQVSGTEIGEEYFPYSVRWNDAIGITPDCPYVLVSVLFGSASYLNNGGTITVPDSIGANGEEYVITQIGWHTFWYPSASINVLQFDFGAFAGIVQILNIQVHCPALLEDCDCEFGNYCSPVLFGCSSDDSTVASLMAALRAEWIADGSTYEAPQCVAAILEGLAADETSDCLVQSEEMAIQFPANYVDVVKNGNFDSGADWTVGGKMSIGSGSLNTTPGVGAGVAFQECLTVGRWYKLTFAMSGWSAGTVEVRLGTGNTVATVGANQTFTIVGQCLNTNQLIFDTSSSATFDGKIDTVIGLEAIPATITAITDHGVAISAITELDRLENDTYFQRFKLQAFGDLNTFRKACFRLYLYTAIDPEGSDTYAPDLCISQPMCAIFDPCHSLLLYAQMENEGESYGWQFPDSTFIGIFAPRMRVWGDLKDAQYPTEKTTYQDSQGTMNVVWAEVREVKTMTINRSPKYVHDFVSLAINTDLFRIIEGDSVTDNVYFNRSDAYAPSWIRISKLAPASVEVEVKTQNLEKNNC